MRNLKGASVSLSKSPKYIHPTQSASHSSYSSHSNDTHPRATHILAWVY